jgi:hypothetical protein
MDEHVSISRSCIRSHAQIRMGYETGELLFLVYECTVHVRFA